MWVFMEKMSVTIELHLVNKQHEVKMDPTFRQNALDLVISPMAEVQTHEATKGRTWGTPDYPGWLSSTYKLQSLHAVRLEGKVPGLSVGLARPHVKSLIPPNVEVAVASVSHILHTAAAVQLKK